MPCPRTTLCFPLFWLCNKVAQAGWQKQQKCIVLAVLEAGKLKFRELAGWFLVRAEGNLSQACLGPHQRTSPWCLFISSVLYTRCALIPSSLKDTN